MRDCFGGFSKLFGRDDAEHNEWQRQKATGDIEFDDADGTSTAGIQELFELSIVGKNARYGLKQIASDPNSFVSLIKRVNIDFANYSLWSGKGRVLLLAAPFPFRRIIGVEFAVELHNAAQDNLIAFANRGFNASRIHYYLPMPPYFHFLSNR